MNYKYFWVIFVYKCLRKEIKIFLKNKNSNFIPFLIEGVKPREFAKIKELFIKLTGINERVCFPNRFFEYSHQLSFEQKSKKIIISSTSVRLLDNFHPNSLLEEGEWFPKYEVLEKLRYDKMFLRSFKKEFGGDSFWECLNTRLHTKK